MVSTRSSSSTSGPSSSSNSSTQKVNSRPSKPRPKSTPAPKFPYDLPYTSLCLRTSPHLYRTGIGEQGVLMVEPYKSELLPHWRFKNPSTATTSSSKLYSIFLSYLEEDDFVGADMARKFIQMGYTRARRYANHKGGKKYNYVDGKKGKEIPRLELGEQEKEKVEAARIFKEILDRDVWENEKYKKLREEHLEWARDKGGVAKDSDEVREAMLEDPGKRQVRKW